MKLHTLLNEAAEIPENTKLFKLKTNVGIASIRDFTFGNKGLIIDAKEGPTVIGIKETLLKIAKKSKLSEDDLVETDEYEVKHYFTVDVAMNTLKSARQYFNEDQKHIAIIDVEAYRKLTKGVKVTVIQEKGMTEEEFGSRALIRIGGRSDGFVEFFIKAAEVDVDIEALEDFKIIDDRLKNISTDKEMSIGVYTYEYGQEQEYTYENGKTKSPYIKIFGNGYVRTGGDKPNTWGEEVIKMIYKPEGNTDLERKTNAWKNAVEYLSKKRAI